MKIVAKYHKIQIVESFALATSVPIITPIFCRKFSLIPYQNEINTTALSKENFGGDLSLQ